MMGDIAVVYIHKNGWKCGWGKLVICISVRNETVGTGSYLCNENDLRLFSVYSLGIKAA
jgi:hypothetical protein